jgi:hypothetical protein
MVCSVECFEVVYVQALKESRSWAAKDFAMAFGIAVADQAAVARAVFPDG